MSVNKVILVGRLGQDPDVRYMPNETAVCNFSLATSSSYKDKTGEKVDQTEWHRIVMFGKVAEIAKEYLKKGSQIFVEGRLQTRKWQDKSGADRWTTEIVGSELTMLGSRQSNPNNGVATDQSEAPFPQDDTGTGLTDDDIPF